MGNTCNYSTEWQPYIGDYDKFEYDIKLKDGRQRNSCYPNARYFSGNLKNGGHFRIHENEVVEIRFAKNQALGINPDELYI